jgi:hypothetical protein
MEIIPLSYLTLGILWCLGLKIYPYQQHSSFPPLLPPSFKNGSTYNLIQYIDLYGKNKNPENLHPVTLLSCFIDNKRKPPQGKMLFPKAQSHNAIQQDSTQR